MAEWWEEDDDESMWWKATRKNAHRLCPDWLWGVTGFGINADGVKDLLSTGKNVGWETELTIAWGAGTKYEKTKVASLVTLSWCTGVYSGAMIDAWYQTHHSGMHLGDALSITVENWWNTQVSGVENLLVHTYAWWKS